MMGQIHKYVKLRFPWFIKLWHQFIDGLYNNRTLWLLLWGASMLSIIDIPISIEFHMPHTLQVAYTVFVGVFKSTLIFICFLLCNKYKWSRIIAYIAIGLLILLSIINYSSLHFFGFGITRRMISIVMQTNSGETAEFLSYVGSLITDTLLSWTFWLTIAGCCSIMYLIRFIPKNILSWTVTAFSAVGFTIVLVFSITFTSGRTAHSLLLRMIKYGIETYQDLKHLNELIQDMPPLPDADTISSTHAASTVVIVIGESASRIHWSIYGYPLSTTPRISAMSDSLYIMSDVIGSSTSTSLNMENILTFRNDDTPEGNTLHYPRLIDLFNRAGYKTFWLSNQEKSGLISNLSAALVSNADEINYVGAQSSEDLLISRFDEVLLPYLQKALNDNAKYKMIFLHLHGSHVVYSSRFPSEARYFTADSIKVARSNMGYSDDEAYTIAEYDNSIRYTDQLLGDILKEISKSLEPTVFIYFSDHGVNVYDTDKIHGRSERYVMVPAIAYLNSTYRHYNPDIAAAFERAVNLPISTASLTYPLMTLTGTTYSHYEPTRDFLSTQYLCRHRYVDGEQWKWE